MFWRKTRGAIGRFHPAHQQLTMERTFSSSSVPGEWAAVLASLSQHDANVKRRKWRLPPRVPSVVAPLIQVLLEDTARDKPIGVAVDLRGTDVIGKVGPKRDLPVAKGRIRKITEWFAFDQWLRLHAELRDGSVIELRVTDRTRTRKLHVVNARGKHKWKKKKKAVQRIDARRTLPRDMPAHRPRRLSAGLDHGTAQGRQADHAQRHRQAQPACPTTPTSSRRSSRC